MWHWRESPCCMLNKSWEPIQLFMCANRNLRTMLDTLVLLMSKRVCDCVRVESQSPVCMSTVSVYSGCVYFVRELQSAVHIQTKLKYSSLKVRNRIFDLVFMRACKAEHEALTFRRNVSVKSAPSILSPSSFVVARIYACRCRHTMHQCDVFYSYIMHVK